MIGIGYFTGEKPDVPKYPTIDFGSEITQNILNNLSGIPGLGKLAAAVNLLSSNQIETQMERQIPGYRNMLNLGTANITAGLQGQLPPGVQAQIERDIAEKGQSTGTAGSQFNTADALRTLGLNKLAYAQQSLDSASRWIAQAQSRAPVFDFTRMFVSPQERIQVRQQENQMKFQRDWLAAKIHSIPWGWKGFATDLTNAVIQDAHTFGQMMAGYGAMSMVGGIGGGGEEASTASGSAASGASSSAGNWQSYVNKYSSMMGGGGGGSKPGQWSGAGSETPNYMGLWQ